MIHAITYIIFILIFTPWLGHELKRTYSLKKYWKWVLGAVLVGLLGALVSHIYDDKFGNFLLHASGGISSTLLFIYVFKTLRLSFSWLLTTMFLFAFVSTLGVLNELAEYAFESLGVGIFSFDSHDTWRDFVANSSGAALAWLVYCAIRRLKTDKRAQSEWF